MGNIEPERKQKLQLQEFLELAKKVKALNHHYITIRNCIVDDNWIIDPVIDNLTVCFEACHFIGKIENFHFLVAKKIVLRHCTSAEDCELYFNGPGDPVQYRCIEISKCELNFIEFWEPVGQLNIVASKINRLAFINHRTEHQLFGSCIISGSWLSTIELSHVEFIDFRITVCYVNELHAQSSIFESMSIELDNYAVDKQFKQVASLSFYWCQFKRNLRISTYTSISSRFRSESKTPMNPPERFIIDKLRSFPKNIIGQVVFRFARAESTQHLNIDMDLTSIDSLQLHGSNQRDGLSISNSIIDKISFENFTNKNEIHFDSITSKLINPELNFKSSDIGLIYFKRSNLQHWNVKFESSSIIDLKYFGSQLPALNSESIDQAEAVALYEAARQLRVVAERNHDAVQTMNYRSLEAKLYWKVSNYSLKNNWSEYLIGLVHRVNDYGQKWVRPLSIATLLAFNLAILFGSIQWIRLGAKFAWPMFKQTAVYLMLPPFFGDLTNHGLIFIFLIVIGKTINSVLYFQSITAFRKYLKSS